MSTPEIVIIVMWAIDLLVAARWHGRDKEGKWNFWNILFQIVVTFGILYWAGLFR